MTKTDREFVELTAERVATKVVMAFLKELPCSEHEKRLLEHSTVLFNGLRSAVEQLKQATQTFDKDLRDHIDTHRKYQNEHRKGVRGFWLRIAAGVLIGMGTFALSMIFMRIIGN